MIFRAGVRDGQGRLGKIYFPSTNIMKAKEFIAANWPHHAIVSIQHIVNPGVVVEELTTQIRILHETISKAFQLRQKYAAEVQVLLTKKAKSTDELDRVLLLNNYVADIDKDLGMLRKKVINKQDVIKEIHEMGLVKTV